MEALIRLNLFKTSSDVQQGIWSTRIYLLLLIVGSSILAIYTSVTLHTISVTVNKPSWAHFQQLYTKYSLELSCPCTDISIPYESFITIQPRFHQVCSSDFVQTDRWLEYFTWAYNPNITTYPSRVYPAFDFRVKGQLYFFFLRSLCQLAVKTVANAIATFNKTKFVSAEPMFKAHFNAQTSLIIQQLQENVSNSMISAKDRHMLYRIPLS